MLSRTTSCTSRFTCLKEQHHPQKRAPEPNWWELNAWPLRCGRNNFISQILPPWKLAHQSLSRPMTWRWRCVCCRTSRNWGAAGEGAWQHIGGKNSAQQTQTSTPKWASLPCHFCTWGCTEPRAPAGLRAWQVLLPPGAQNWHTEGTRLQKCWPSVSGV